MPDIAIVGMAFRFPQASTEKQFWDLILSGRSTGGSLDDISGFDASFFTISGREAAQMDPQQRLFLECAYHALEDAGYAAPAADLRIGVFASAGYQLHPLDTYLVNNIMAEGWDRTDWASAARAAVGTTADFLATRVAYRLDLVGPAVSVQTACSSGLVAVHQAAQAILSGDADMALAGAAAVMVPQASSYRRLNGSVLSSSGQCRAFDAGADGTVAGSGVAAVVLKRLDHALADGDTVHAVIRGVGITNDGARKDSFTAPSTTGQRDAVRRALQRAGVTADSVGYLEAHGTGTLKGDPIEFDGLSAGYDVPGALGFCALGSVKSNLGHLDVCAGLAGLIKAILVLKHGVIPPLANFTLPNPLLRLDGSPFSLPDRVRAWPASARPRRAGVHSLGVGGTNVHLILEQAPEPREFAPSVPPPPLLALSAHAGPALAESARAWRDRLRENPPPAVEDVITTALTGRRPLRHRLVAFGTDAEALAEALDAFLGGTTTASCITGEAYRGAGSIAMIYSGQGSSYPGMARALYDRFSLVREVLDECEELHRSAGGGSLIEPLLDQEGSLPGETRDTSTEQPAIFAYQMACTRLWQQWGLTPAVTAGHSVGEFAALSAAGALSLADGVRVLTLRGQLMKQRMRAGAMIAVRAGQECVEQAIAAVPGLELAVVNGLENYVLAGSRAAVQAARRHLEDRGVPARVLPVERAFHSAALDPVLDELRDIVRTVRLAPVRIPFLSGVDGVLRPAGWQPHVNYLVEQARLPVRFDGVLDNLTNARHVAVLDVGPGNSLSGLLSARDPDAAAVPGQRRGRELPALWSAVAALFCRGLPVDWAAVLHGARTRRIPMPRYPFQHTKYWVGPESAPPKPAPIDQAPSEELTVPRLTLEKVAELASRNLGCARSEISPDRAFVELGADSFQMVSLQRELTQELGIQVSMRELFEEASTPALLVELAARRVGRSEPPEPAPQPQPRPMIPVAAAEPVVSGPRVTVPVTSGMAAGSISDRQNAHLTGLVQRYTERTRTSKALAQRYRPILADSRATVGFRKSTKEMLYPLTAQRAAGSSIEDVDGNRYIDLTMGFGVLLFGHEPDFVTDAVLEHLAHGIRLGPRAGEAGEAAELLAELTGHERVAFANSGTEANSAAIRLARAATGRTKIVTFQGAYHGHADNVLGRTGADGHTVPLSRGIPQAAVDDLIVLPFGDPASLETIAALGDQLAAVVVEPVQSRNPGVRPAEFVQSLRDVTSKHGIVLLFDEMLTGFRPHPRGAQGYYRVQADLATYGKVLGGGYPIGAIAGRSDLLDLIDGGFWQYGDSSGPSQDTTFFGGTYLQHPLAMTAAKAVLSHLNENSPVLQDNLNARTDDLSARLNSFFEDEEFPLRMRHFGSMFRFEHRADMDLLYHHMMLRGLYVWEWRSFFLSTAHSDHDLDAITDIVTGSLRDMRQGGFLPGKSPALRAAATRKAERPAPAFSLSFFGDYPERTGGSDNADRYQLLIEAAQFADDHGFHGVWLPERHFHSFGGVFPNPAVLAAAMARETKRIRINAGSVVLPLHDPIRVAEEWSMVDNLSGGRIGIGCASGWNSRDFVFYPDAFGQHKAVTRERLEHIRDLWRGKAIRRRIGDGTDSEVRLFPRPIQQEPPMFMAIVGRRESYEEAARADLGVLTNLMSQSIDQLAENVAHYRAIRAEQGLDPDAGRVVVLLHTYLGTDLDVARAEALEPLSNYMRSSLALSGSVSNSLGMNIDVAGASEDDLDFVFRRAYRRYCDQRSLIGTPESCADVVNALRRAGADEVAALVDFGVTPEQLRGSLGHLDRLRRLCQEDARDGSSATPRQPAADGPTHRSAPATMAQRRLWLAARMAPEMAYNEFQAVRLHGALNLTALSDAVQAVADRHDGLRTVFRNPADDDAGARLEQTVLPPKLGVLNVIDARGRTPDDAIEAVLRAENERVYNLADGPLFVPSVVRIGDDDHLLVLGMHHIIADSRSAELITADLQVAYRAAGGGSRIVFGRPAGSAVDLPAIEEDPEDVAWWRSHLGTAPPALCLPVEQQHSRSSTGRAASVQARLDAEVTHRLQSWSGRQRVTLFATLFTAWQAVLRRFSGQDEFLLVTTYGERQPQAQDVVGFFVSLLPLRCSMTDQTGLADAARTVRDTLHDARDHLRVRLDSLLAELNPEPGAARPLLRAAIDLDAEALTGIQLPGLRAEPIAAASDAAPLELTLLVTRAAKGLELRIRYDEDLYDRATAARLADHLRLVLTTMADDRAATVGELPLTTAHDDHLLRLWESGGHPAGPQLTTMATVRPADTEEVAIVDADGLEWTRSQLRRAADTVTARLQAVGVEPGDVVAIALPRGAGLLAGLLGIVGSGAAYLPVDPSQPVARLSTMLDDARPRILIIEDGDHPIARAMPGIPRIAVDVHAQPMEPVSQSVSEPADLHYVLYTSGSTGRPKGVAVEHRNMAAALGWYLSEVPVTSADRLSWYASPGFDFGHLEFWPALAAGARLYVVPDEVRLDPSALAAWFVSHGITVANLPTPIGEAVLAESWPEDAAMRVIHIGGEQLVARPRSGTPFAVVNVYGPTEATVFCTWDAVSADESGAPPIGRPVPGTHARVLDTAGRLVPPQVTGELHLGGAQVARGYYGSPAVTQERFTTDPDGRRWYRTGDLVRWRSDGRLAFVGRNDDQVQIRGVRVEPAEVTRAVAALPEVAEALVVGSTPQGAGSSHLTAWVRPRNRTVDDDAAIVRWRGQLSALLPRPMVPERWIITDHLPVNGNGKRLRRAEPEPPQHSGDAKDEPAATVRTEWCAVLGREDTPPGAAFFDLGGHSLLVVELLGRIERKCGVKLSFAEFFDDPTVEGMSAAVRRANGSASRVSGRL